MGQNGQLTVRELYQDLRQLMREGRGDDYIVVSDDEEGNSYHGIFYGATADPKDIRECIEFSNGLYGSVTDDPNKLIIIG